MFGSDILDVVIGLSFTFFLLSIVASSAQELIAQALQWRRSTLRKGIGDILGDPTLTGLAGAVYAHPLVSALGSPSYLKNTRFADSLIETLSTAASAADTTFASVVAGIAALPDGPAKTQLQLLVRQSGAQLDALRTNVGQWFDDAMDRVGGRYKRSTQKVLLGLGILLALIFNIDALGMAQTLANNPAVRNALVAQAASASEASTPPSSSDAIKALTGLDPAIGWSVCWYATAPNPSRAADALPAPCGANQGGAMPPVDAWATYALWRIPGWLLTALAVTLGAPFWFDIFTKLLNVSLRATGKKPE